MATKSKTQPTPTLKDFYNAGKDDWHVGMWVRADQITSNDLEGYELLSDKNTNVNFLARVNDVFRGFARFYDLGIEVSILTESDSRKNFYRTDGDVDEDCEDDEDEHDSEEDSEDELSSNSVGIEVVAICLPRRWIYDTSKSYDIRFSVPTSPFRIITDNCLEEELEDYEFNSEEDKLIVDLSMFNMNYVESRSNLAHYISIMLRRVTIDTPSGKFNNHSESISFLPTGELKITKKRNFSLENGSPNLSNLTLLSNPNYKFPPYLKLLDRSDSIDRAFKANIEISYPYHGISGDGGVQIILHGVNFLPENIVGKKLDNSPFGNSLVRTSIKGIELAVDPMFLDRTKGMEEEVPLEKVIEKFSHEILSESKDKLSSLNEEINTLREKLRDRYKQIGAVDLILKSSSSEVIDRFHKMMSYAQEDPRIDKIKFNLKGIEITTKDLFVDNGSFLSLVSQEKGRDKYYLGRYKIMIKNKGVVLKNINCRFMEEPHPHGFDTSVCLGTFEEAMYRALGTYDYRLLLMTILEFLVSVNPKDSRAVRIARRLSSEVKEYKQQSKWMEVV